MQITIKKFYEADYIGSGNIDWYKEYCAVNKELTALKSQFQYPLPDEAGELSEEKFCKLHSGYCGKEIDNIKQLVQIRFTGQELFEFCQYLIKQFHPEPPSGEDAVRFKREDGNIG